ncbi:MAG: hypothetical protein BWX67_01907 [Thermotogae bacterium ADurb.Bin062]|jgi:hypothetical protein|nr:MAG: hypothetical protein BWX67_01907 [Thermotogota bacterium ADurb.Bin062]
MPKRGYRGVTNGTPRSPFCYLYIAMPVPGYRAVARRRSAYAAMPESGYRAVAKRRCAYAAMPKRGYRGVTNGTPRSPFCFLYTAMLSGYRAVTRRRSAYAAMPVSGYRAVARRRGAYAAMPAKTPRCPYKSVSRRREKKKRLHRDDIPKT